MRLVLTLLALAALSATARPAAAAIRVAEARVANGYLVISGDTDLPSFLVVLDDRYSAAPDGQGRFSFRLLYVPPDCVGTLRAGDETRRVTIADCTPRPAARAPAVPEPQAPQHETGAPDAPAAPTAAPTNDSASRDGEKSAGNGKSAEEPQSEGARAAPPRPARARAPGRARAPAVQRTRSARADGAARRRLRAARRAPGSRQTVTIIYGTVPQGFPLFVDGEERGLVHPLPGGGAIRTQRVYPIGVDRYP